MYKREQLLGVWSFRFGPFSRTLGFYMGIMEKKMETTGIIGIILGFYRDNGMAIWLSGLGFRD